MNTPDQRAALERIKRKLNNTLAVVSPFYAKVLTAALADIDALLAVPDDDATTNDQLIHALAQCRDAFPIPERGDKLEREWSSAIGDPLSVPDYVRAALVAFEAAQPVQPISDAAKGALKVAVDLLREVVGPLEVSAAVIEDEDGGEAIETLLASVKRYVEQFDRAGLATPTGEAAGAEIQDDGPEPLTEETAREYAADPAKALRSIKSTAEDAVVSGDAPMWLWALQDIAQVSFAALHTEAAASVQPVPQTDECIVKREDANNYSRILTLLGMEEEGDPVEAVQKLVAESDAAAEITAGVAAPLANQSPTNIMQCKQCKSNMVAGNGCHAEDCQMTVSQTDYERGRQDGIKQERAMHEHSKLSQEIEAAPQADQSGVPSQESVQPVLLLDGATVQDFIGAMLFDFQQATGCDTAEEFLAERRAIASQEAAPAQAMEVLAELVKHHFTDEHGIAESWVTWDRARALVSKQSPGEQAEAAYQRAKQKDNAPRTSSGQSQKGPQ